MKQKRHIIARLRPKAWSAETWVCSMRGHVTPAAFVERLDPSDAMLGVELEGGHRLVRCLRCDLWVAEAAPRQPTRPTLGPIDELPRPRRGVALDEGILLRLISLDRAVHSILFTILAIVLVAVRLQFGAVERWARSLYNDLGAGGHPLLSSQLEHLLGLKRESVTLLLVMAVAYALIEGVEAVGLWRERRWAEYLTVVATAGFLPLEIHELMRKVTVLRVSALVINLAIVVYLLLAKRLFGIRGGASAAAAEGTDWTEVLAQPGLQPTIIEHG
jgi:uncharacterized membrane protein (DUF2068 family)